jgi:hypothetical protein
MTTTPNTDTDMDSITTVSESSLPSYTYAIDYNSTGKISGYCDELAAVKQAIYKIINTERYQYIIYSWNYGIEVKDLIGKPIPYIYAETQRRIIEALMTDDRITNVDDFKFSNNGGDVAIHFTVTTIYGKVTATKEVAGIV